jgi:hypothetical protein
MEHLEPDTLHRNNRYYIGPFTRRRQKHGIPTFSNLARSYLATRTGKLNAPLDMMLKFTGRIVTNT